MTYIKLTANCKLFYIQSFYGYRYCSKVNVWATLIWCIHQHEYKSVLPVNQQQPHFNSLKCCHIFPIKILATLYTLSFSQFTWLIIDSEFTPCIFCPFMYYYQMNFIQISLSILPKIAPCMICELVYYHKAHPVSELAWI